MRPLKPFASVDRLLELLVQELRIRLGEDLFAELEVQQERLNLGLSVPVTESTAQIARAQKKFRADLEAKVEALRKDHHYFPPGAAFCFRCTTAECEHSRPGSPREVFAGYEKVGVPRFTGLGQYLMESADPRAQLLFEGQDSFLTRVDGGQSLTKAILAPFRRSQEGLYLHGQVVAGWFTVPHQDSDRIALSFLLYSHRRSRDRRTYRLQPVFPPQLGALYPEKNLEAPWRPALRTVQPIIRKLNELEAQSHRSKEGQAIQNQLVEKLLRQLADFLDRPVQSRKKKTRHGRKRHQLTDRPTSQARRDAIQAADESLFFDHENNTVVVLGPKGRIHIFTPKGQLVTSLRLNKVSLNRRLDQKRWIVAQPVQVSSFRKFLNHRNTPQ